MHRFVHPRLGAFGLLAAGLIACSNDVSAPTTIAPPDQPDALTVGARLEILSPSVPFSVASQDINDAGMVTGWAMPPEAGGRQRPFRWSAATGFEIIDVTLGGSAMSAMAINEHGDLAGFGSTASTGSRAFRWTEARGLELLADDGSSRAVGINDDGVIAGSSTFRNPLTGQLVQRATRWRADGTRDSVPLPGSGSFSNAVGINNGGAVAGEWFTGGRFRPFLWTPEAGVRDLGMLPGSTSCSPSDVNVLNHVIGRCFTSSGPRAFRWTPEHGLEDLGTLGGAWAQATAINDAGEIMGISQLATGMSATFFWSQADGMENVSAHMNGVGDPIAMNSRRQFVMGVLLGKVDVEPSNAPPVVGAGGPYTGNEGSPIALTLGATDPDGDALTYTWDLGDGTTGTGTSLPGHHTYADDGTYTVTLTATDAKSDPQTATATVTVSNVAPTLGALTAPAAPIVVGAAVAVEATVTDPGILDSHTAIIDWGDGSTSTAAVAAGTNAATVSAAHAYAAAGVYTVQMTVTDNDGGVSNTGRLEYVVVYDPSAGFVTGGGWILSPAGACRLTERCGSAAAGKATFGFVSRYQNGANVPTGNTQFQYHAGNFGFRSTNYEWLVISGAMAQYKGSGSINGAGDYGFLLTATDGQLRGDGVDRFRIKIWEKGTGRVIYDNDVESAADDLTVNPQALAGGSIQIQKR